MSETALWPQGPLGGYCEHGILLCERCHECERDMYLDMTLSDLPDQQDDPYEG